MATPATTSLRVLAGITETSLFQVLIERSSTATDTHDRGSTNTYSCSIASARALSLAASAELAGARRKSEIGVDSIATGSVRDGGASGISSDAVSWRAASSSLHTNSAASSAAGIRATTNSASRGAIR